MEEDLKSFARGLIGAANQLAGLGAAVYFVVLFLHPQGEEPLSRGLLAVLGGGLLFLNFLRLLYLRSSKPAGGEGPLLSHTKDGIVQVARDAIEAGLKSAGEALPEVSRIRVKVLTPVKRKVLIRAHYLAPEGTEIFALSARLRRTLLEAFERMVQLDREGRLELDLIFEGFYGKPKTAAKETAKRKPEDREESPAPFTGPRYPIEESDEAL